MNRSIFNLISVKKGAILLAVLFGFNPSIFGQFWMQKAGGLTIDEAYDISIDNAGNAYSVGYFTGTSNFGSTSLTSGGSTDIFVTKNDNLGAFSWAVKAGGTGSDRALAVKTDASGNSFVTGYFSGSATFGSTTLVSSGLQDIFIAKYDNLGALAWVVKAGGLDADIGFGITVSTSGNIYVTGSFKGSASFGTTILTSANTTSDVFTAKLNPSGVFQWAKSGTGNYTNRGVDIGVDNSDNVYITGQFSDTITFDTQHPNQMQSAIFVVKYDSAGTEQWFKIIGGGVTNIPSGIAVDGTGNSFLTGDFTGTLTFFGTPNVSLSNPHTNKIYVAKLNTSGIVQWTHADGSEGDISSANININNSGSCWITGSFSCKLNEYADQYGQGTFNSVGGSDIFVTRYNASGTWNHSKSMGGTGTDKGYGIAVNTSNQIYIAGSFGNSMNVPTSSTFVSSNLALWNDISCANNSPYCSDSNYGSFHSMQTAGNLDAVIGRCLPESREPYDFYNRTGGSASCVRDEGTVCIDSLCPTSVTGCNIVTLTPISAFCDGAGPNYTYSWSPGITPIGGTDQVTANVSGTYFVTQTSADGCFSSIDSIEVVIVPSPNTPLISDDKGFNTNNLIPQHIEACDPDTVTVWASGFDTSLTYYWEGPGLPGGGLVDSVFTTSNTGLFIFHVINAMGCEITNQVLISFYDTLPPFPLKMALEDSVTVCDSSSFTVQLYDSVNNPGINPVCLVDPEFSIVTNWAITPTAGISTVCGTYGFFTPTASGWYDVTATFIRINYCFTDTTVLTKTVYVTLNPSPYIPPFNITIQGGPNLCPGDTFQLTATGAPNYLWYGPGVTGSTDSIVDVYTAGLYLVGSVVNDTNSFGCTANYTTTSQIQIYDKQQPTVTAASEVICPGDSVLLSSSSPTGNNWEGPNGPILDSSAYIYVTDPGYYYTIVNDSDSCAIVSNAILLSQYTTPLLVASGDTFICAGDSTTITVQASSTSIIEWQPPLSGNGFTQVIYSAGTYTVKITSCGIETYASITIYSSDALATITPSGVLCQDSSITLSGIPGMVSYLWMPGGETTSSITVSNPGNFTLAIMDTNGCAGLSDTLTIDEISVPASITSVANGFCNGDSLSLMGNSGMTNYLWAPTGDTTQSIITYQPGTFTLVVTDTNGCVGISDPVVIVVPDTIASLVLLGADYFCEGESVVLDASSPIAASYLWYPNNETSDQITVFQTGTFAVSTVDTFGCKAYSDTINILVDSNKLQIPTVSNDTTICAGSTVMLVASVDSGNLVWYNPLGAPSVGTGNSYSPLVIDETRFYVRAESQVCVGELASVLVSTFDCENVLVGNVFTPNGDGVNDYFQIQIYGTTYFNVEIYNRWGTLIYTLDHPNQRWDGTMYESGEALPDGTYYYVLTYGKYDGTDQTQKGNVTMIR